MSVYIREITENDTDLIIKWRNSEHVKKRFIYRKNITRESHTNWLNEKVKKGICKQFIIYIADIEKPIGSVYLSNIDYENQNAEYGIFIGESDELGKGYGSEAGKLILEYAFNQLKLHKVYLRVFADNLSAINSYRKIGFVQEGLLKEEVMINGRFKDLVRMSRFQYIYMISSISRNVFLGLYIILFGSNGFCTN